MTNDPRNPTPGQPPEQPGTPQNPQQSPGMGSPRPSGSDQGATPETGTSATPARSARPESDERTYRASEQPARPAGATTTQTYEPAQQSSTYQAAPPRTYDAPRSDKKYKLFALLGILALVAGAGIIAGFAASNNSTPTAFPSHARHVPTTPGGTLVASVRGTGVRYSGTFRATGAPVTARYTYTCSSGTHPFIAAIAASRTNVVPIANTRGTGGSSTVTVHPTTTGLYRVAASSPCPYHVTVYQR